MVLGCCDDDQAGGLPLQILSGHLQHQGLSFPHFGHTGSTCKSFVPTVLPGLNSVANCYLKTHTCSVSGERVRSQ